MRLPYQSICHKYGSSLKILGTDVSFVTLVCGVFGTGEVSGPFVWGGGTGAAAGVTAAVFCEPYFRDLLKNRGYSRKAGSSLLRRLQFASVAAGIVAGMVVVAAVEVGLPKLPPVLFAAATPLPSPP